MALVREECALEWQRPWQRTTWEGTLTQKVFGGLSVQEGLGYLRPGTKGLRRVGCEGEVRVTSLENISIWALKLKQRHVHRELPPCLHAMNSPSLILCL